MGRMLSVVMCAPVEWVEKARRGAQTPRAYGARARPFRPGRTGMRQAQVLQISGTAAEPFRRQRRGCRRSRMQRHRATTQRTGRRSEACCSVLEVHAAQVVQLRQLSLRLAQGEPCQHCGDNRWKQRDGDHQNVSIWHGRAFVIRSVTSVHGRCCLALQTRPQVTVVGFLHERWT